MAWEDINTPKGLEMANSELGKGLRFCEVRRVGGGHAEELEKLVEMEEEQRATATAEKEKEKDEKKS